MHFSSYRRRFVAAFAAMGAAGLLPSLARAQDEPTGDATPAAPDAAPPTAPCTEQSMAGTWAEPANNYTITATRADFAFVAAIKAVGDNIVLYAEPAQGGVSTSSLALVKGTLTRTEQGAELTPLSIGFEAPLTAMDDKGQYYGIISLAHDQKVPAGVVFFDGDTRFGEFEFKPEAFDPKSREFSFDALAAGQLYDKLMGDTPFKVALVAGGTTYSELTTTPGDFATFIDGLVVRMDALAEQDKSAPCAAPAGGVTYDPSSSYDCFLTTACCTIIGLADDCWELKTLRRLRDGWMSRFPAGRADIARYYREAPAIAAALATSPGGRARLLRLYWSVIVPAALLARLGANKTAYRLYRAMMLSLLGTSTQSM